MKKGIYILPNALTMCGMFSGYFAIVASLKGDFVHSAWAILLAGVFDGLDGWVARLTHSTTKFGIELDSLSDLVAFGVAPSLLAYRWSLVSFGRIGWVAAFLFAACGALRLARYNVQMGSTEKKYFTGMPIPAAASIVATTVIFFDYMGWQPGRHVIFPVMTVLVSFLMVHTMKFHSVKEIDFSKRKPFWLLVTILLAFSIVVMHPEIALFVFAMTYLAEGIIENIYTYMRSGVTRKEKA